MESSPRPESRSENQRPPTLLIVDDEVILRATVAEYFRFEGWQVLEAPDSVQAKRMLSTNGSIDLVLSDVHMPGEDGVALSQHIRNSFPHIPVLLTSGDGRPSAAGSTPFIAKPFSLLRLLQTAQLLLDQGDEDGSLNRK